MHETGRGRERETEIPLETEYELVRLLRKAHAELVFSLSTFLSLTVPLSVSDFLHPCVSFYLVNRKSNWHLGQCCFQVAFLNLDPLFY